MFEVSENNMITMTRGDTASFYIGIEDIFENDFRPLPTDKLVFSVKQKYKDDECVIQKEIPLDTQILKLEPDDTKPLMMPKKYYYDVQLIRENGDVYTIIAKGKLKIKEEVG